MKLREFLYRSLANAFGYEMVGMFLSMIIVLVLGIVGRDMWPGFAMFAFFGGAFFGRVAFIPPEKKTYFGFKYISEEELER